MAKKRKKKLEDDAWMWMSQPAVPGMIKNPFFKYSFTGDVLEIKVPLTWEEEIAAQEQGRRNVAEGFGEAWGYYTLAGLLDPKNPLVDARIVAAALGVSWWSGLFIAAVIGAPIAGVVLTIIDPQHKWEGGLDEYPLSGTHPNLNKEILMGAGSWGTVV